MHNVGHILIHVSKGMKIDDRLTPSAIYEMVAEGLGNEIYKR